MKQTRFSKKVVISVLVFIALITIWFFYMIMSKDLSNQICDVLKHIYTLIMGVATAELTMLWRARETEKQYENQANITEKVEEKAE